MRHVTPDEAIKHWEKVLATPRLPAISYEFARGALATLRGPEEEQEPREPGIDG